MIAEAAADLSMFDKGLAIGVIAFFMGLLAWALKRYFGTGGIAEQRSKSIHELAESIASLTTTCHECRDEQKDYMRDLQTQLARYADVLEGQ